MTYDEFVAALKNVRLTCKDNYTAAYQADVKQKKDLFDPGVYESLQAIQPGGSWGATIVLDRDFQLINGTLTNAGPTVPHGDPYYQEVADMIRAILPDNLSLDAFETYIQAHSTIFPTAVTDPWTPARVQLTLFGLDWGQGFIMITVRCIPHPS